MSKTGTFSAETVEKIAELAKLGPTLPASDVARVLGLDEQQLEQFLRTPAGKRVWQQARARGRAEVLAQIRNLAVSGSPQAQKLMTELLTTDDTARWPDLKIPAAAVRTMAGRGKTALTARVAKGEMAPVGPNRCYRLGDIVGTLPRLWSIIADLRKENVRLVAANEKAATSEGEARREAMIERARKLRLQNNEHEGRLLNAEEVERGRVQRILVVKSALLGLPSAMAPMLAGQEAHVVADLLDDRLREIISGFAGQAYSPRHAHAPHERREGTAEPARATQTSETASDTGQIASEPARGC